MNLLRRLLIPAAISTLVFQAHAAEAPPEKALKYHSALLKRPSNDTLFDRFFGSWIDEQPLDSLEAFLTARAAQHGGPDLSILARYQLRRGLEDDALATLGKAIAALPDEPTLTMERAKILLRRLEFEAARDDLAKSAAGNDESIALEAAKLIGKSWLRQGNPEQAIKAWDALLAANPGDEDLLEDLVESAAAEGEIDQALTYVDQLIAAGADPYKKTLRQLRRGDLLAQAGRNDEAVQTYTATLAQVGEGSWLEREVLAQIDKVFRKQDRIDDLKNAFIKLAEDNPRRLLIHRQLAKIEAAQGETDSAVGRFREVLKRSPGNRELREEFVRLLTDGEKYQDAAEELEKLIKQAPDDAGLQLQMADLRHRQDNEKATLAALETARTLFPQNEPSGIRIASLMLQYGLAEQGEALLKSLAAAANATPAPSEALAAEYARTNRKQEALAILEKVADSDQLDVVLRAAASISALGQTDSAHTILTAKSAAFPSEPRFLAALAQSALAAAKPDEAIPPATKLVRLATQSAELADAASLALRAITTAQKTIELRESLGKKADRTPSETCLLAALADSQNDFPAVTTLMHGATDPLVIRFHAALLDKRGDFPAAIATLSRLADTPEGRKTSFFREMSDLQRRAGLIDDALATVERWKQSAPGDKAAWVTGASLLRQAGRPEDAVQMTRQAVARFEGDSDLAASLASLHEEAGQMQDADAIYWRLYDDSASPSDQARWAAKLAQLSLRTGRTDELAEKLAQRARSNRGSVGPILAQAELARVTRNEEKRRDLLLEAVRLQPKDIDLRLQIANLEEQSGNPDRVIAILEEAADIDTTGRIRSALAQAYLRQGQVMKGMRELRALAGKQGEDPRTIEQSAASLAATGLYEEAIRFLRESIPGGGDWRSRYLLAIMLEQDGRETEAIPLFQTLLQASGELAGRNAAANHPAPNVTTGWDPYGKQVASIIELMYAANAAYSHRDNNSYGNYGTRNITRVGPFALPDEPETARTLSRIHLAKLGVDDGQNSGFVAEILSASPQGRPDFPAMLAKYPEQPGLLEITLLYSSWGNQQGAPTPETIRKALAKRPDLSASNRFLAYLRLAHGTEASDPVWQQLITAAADATTDPNSPEAIQIAFHLMNFLVQSRDDIPETHHKPLADTLLRVASSEKANEGMFRGFHLAAVKLVGTTDQLIAVINSEVENHRNDPANKNQLGMSLRTRTQISYSMGGSQYNPWLSRGKSPFSLPDLDDCNFTSLPASIIQMIRKSVAQFQQTIDPASLLDHLDSVSSPALRAWIALSAGDDAAAEKALSATPPDAETTDFNTLRAIRAIGQKDYPAAFRHFAATRPALSADRTVTTWLNLTLVAIASEMTPDQREAILDPLRAMLIQCRQPLGTEGLPLLAAQAEKLGMPELAARFTPAVVSRNSPNTPLGAARFGSRSSSGSSNSGNATIDKLKKFTADGKIEAAAMEALNLIRKLNRSSYSSSYERRQIRENLNEEVLAELFRMIDPGDSKSLTKLMEYAGICEHFGKPEQALAVLRRLHADRPDDVSVSARLAFLLPPAERDLAIELITRSVKLPEFATFAATSAETLDDEENNASSFAWFETVISFLESADPTTIRDANLTWVAYYAKEFFTGDFTEDLPNLTRSISDNNKQHKDYQQFVSLAKRLAFAMHRHPSICEEGFRLIRVSNAWQIPDAEMDALARTVLLNASLTSTDTYSRYWFFRLVRGNGSSSSGDDLPANSSVKWLTDRLDNATSPDEILPAAYLGELTKTNPEVATIVSALANLTDIAGLETFWKSDALAKAAGPYAGMLRKGVLSRAAAIPGASSFFLKQLAEIKPGFLSGNSYFGNARESTVTLLTAALSAGARTDTKELDAICKAVTTILFGEKIDFSDPGDGQATYTAINLMQNLLRTAEFPPATAARVYSAFHRLGTPISDSDYYLAEPFRGISIPNAAKGEAFFNSLGLLDDIDTWRPFAAIIAEANHTGNSITFTRSEKFILPEIASRMNWGINRSIMVKHLKNRKPRTFGALITAASLTDGNERSQLTATAFTNAAPQLAKLSPQRVADFALLIPWLPKDTIAKLPASFRQKADSANATRLASLIERADSFLKSPPANNYNSPLDEVEELVSELAPLDLDKAVAVFLEAERRFTASLTRGGRLSSYTSSGLQITERDEALSDLFSTYSETPFTTDPVLGLRFHAAIAASPEATRFSFARSSKGLPILYSIGRYIYLSAPGKTGPNDPRWLLAMRYVSNMPEDVQKDAYIALCTYLIGNINNPNTPDYANFVDLPKDRTAIAKMKSLRKHFADLRGMRIGITGWKTDTPEGRSSTMKTLLSMAGDESVAPITRFQLLSLAVTQMPPLLQEPKICEAFASMFSEYAAGERTIINTLGILGIVATNRAMILEKTRPFHASINRDFWNNANSPKPGGHPPIPEDAGEHLFMAAANSGDTKTARKLLALARPSIIGNVRVIANLISAGELELASEILSPPGRIYRRSSKFIDYTIHFEKQLDAFRKLPGLDPLALLRIEAQFLDATLVKGDQQPNEDEATREARLIATYKANPPADPLLRTELLAAFVRDSHRAALALAPELAAKTAKLDLANTLTDWQQGTGNENDPSPRFIVAPQEAAIIRQAAFVRFLAGDPAPLDAIAETLLAFPRSPSRTPNNGTRNHVDIFINRLCRSAPAWVAEAIHRDSTASFASAFDIFAKFCRVTEKRTELDFYDMIEPVAMAEFFAYWNDTPKAFDKLLASMKKEAKKLAYFKKHWGCKHIVLFGQYMRLWDRDSFRDARRSFLIATFTRPSMNDYCATPNGWFFSLPKRDLADDLYAIAKAPPEGLLPLVQPYLYKFASDKAGWKKDPATAAAFLRKAIAAMPDTAQWRNLRGSYKQNLVNLLLLMKQPAEAKKAYDSIAKNEIPAKKQRIKQHADLGKKVAKALKN